MKIHMWMYIILKSATISLAGSFNRRKHCNLWAKVKFKFWGKEKEVWEGAL